MRAMIIILLAVVVTAGIRAGTNEYLTATNYMIQSIYAETCYITNGWAEVSQDIHITEGGWTNCVRVIGTNGITRVYEIKHGELKEVKKARGK